MMKIPSLGLKLQIIFTLLLLFFVLIAGFSVLSANYLIRGMDGIVAGNMETAALNYLQTTPVEQRNPYNSLDGYYFATDWQSMPVIIRDAFLQQPPINGLIAKNHDADWFQRPGTIYFALGLEVNDQQIFVARKLTKENASAVIDYNVKHSMKLLLIVSSITLIVIGLLFWLLTRRFTQPITSLVQWTRDLTPETLSLAAPEFAYKELNEMAQLIRASLSSVQESLSREQHFQRHVSHELRTPVSIIRSNISLLHKLEEQGVNADSIHLSSIVNRIDRASLTMKNLIHTLLWLSRSDSSEELPNQPIRLDKLLSEIIEESRHLLKEKDVNVSIHTSPCTIDAPLVPLRIVLGNIIQNAFQHTWEGGVSIDQQGSRINIINKNNYCADMTEELGFGLGLRLTQELAEKMRLSYGNIKEASGHHVVLCLNKEQVERLD